MSRCYSVCCESDSLTVNVRSTVGQTLTLQAVGEAWTDVEKRKVRNGRFWQTEEEAGWLGKSRSTQGKCKDRLQYTKTERERERDGYRATQRKGRGIGKRWKGAEN